MTRNQNEDKLLHLNETDWNLEVRKVQLRQRNMLVPPTFSVPEQTRPEPRTNLDPTWPDPRTAPTHVTSNSATNWSKQISQPVLIQRRILTCKGRSRVYL